MSDNSSISQDIQVLEQLYQDVNGMDVSRRSRDSLVDDNRSFTYGEIVFEEFAKMLALCNPKPGEVFYDLGAGTGKAVFAAALLYDWKKCCGIDLLSGLHECSKSLLQNLKQMPGVETLYGSKLEAIQFVQADLLDADFSDADIIFTHATCFAPELWDPLIEKFARLKPGTRFIIVTKRLNEPDFVLITETNQPFTWGSATVSIYRKA